MSFDPDAPDLTRWNRAGLRRFRYVDGNAITYLERLRAAADTRFVRDGARVWTDLVSDAPADPANETAQARRRRWAARYEGPRRDYAWEILRTLARSTHVLGEHVDAFANEGFIGTATQYDSLRRLVALLDYRPAPPASATTALALLANRALRLPAGFAVQHLPAAAPPVLFETLADVDLDPVLNTVPPRDWDRSQASFAYAPVGEQFEGTLTLADEVALPAVDSAAVLCIDPADDGTGADTIAVRIHAVEGRAVTLRGRPPKGNALLTVPRWRVRVLAGAAAVVRPQLAGSDVVRLEPGHKLSAGARVAWLDGGDWRTARVRVLEADRAQIEGGWFPPGNVDFYLLAQSKRQDTSDGSRALLATERGAGGLVWDDYGAQVDVYSVRIDGRTVYEFVYVANAWYVPAGSTPAARVAQAGLTDLRFDGAPGAVAVGDAVVLDASGPPRVARVLGITRTEKDFTLRLEAGTSIEAGTRVHMGFGQVLRPRDFDRNETPAWLPHAAAARATLLELAPGAWSSLLTRGRVLLVVQGDPAAPRAAARTVVQAVDPLAGTITVAPALPGAGTAEDVQPDAPSWARWETRVFANAVDAGHGEAKPTKTLGGGDATLSSQAFVLDVKDLSHVADAAMPSGVRAALDVFVGEERYTQVGNLRESGRADPHYEVRERDDGGVDLLFGDGVHGRRLPTGSNNLRVTYRQGSGAAGNLPPGSLVKAKNKHPAIDAVLQPVASGGGAAREGTVQMRADAPKRVLTLERAVSVQDFALLAQQHAAVWQAHAYQRPREGVAARRTGGVEAVHVVIVPAGGGVLGVLADELRAYLEGHAAPGVAAVIEDFQPVFLQLDVTVRVDVSRFVPEQVAARVRAALLDAFALRRMRLGAALYVSQLQFVVEQVEGVANATVTVLPATLAEADPPLALGNAPDGGLRSLRPQPWQLIHLDPVRSQLAVRTEAFTL